MLRFLGARSPVASAVRRGTAGSVLTVVGGGGAFLLTSSRRIITTEVRDDVSRSLSLTREEMKGQSQDLSDMSEAARRAQRSLQELSKKYPNVKDGNVSQRLSLLSTAMKAYTNRLSTLHQEAKTIHQDAQSLSKALMGTEADPPKAATSESEAESAGKAAAAAGAFPDIAADVPPMAQKLEQMNAQKAKVVETVSGEVIPDSTFAAQKKQQSNAASSSSSTTETDIEVEAVEVESTTVSSSSSSSSTNTSQGSAAGGSSAAEEAAKEKAAGMSITAITSELHEKGIDFSDCKDARTLRARYCDVLLGKISVTPKRAASQPAEPVRRPSTPPPPPPPQSSGPGANPYGDRTPNTAETGIAADPHPGAHRKMLDPMKYVGEVKIQLAKEHGVDARSIDLWSGLTKLDDSKRLYEYPGLQHNPIEVRNKGDAPRR